MQIKSLTILSAFVLATIVSAHPAGFHLIRRDNGSAFEAGEDKCSLPSDTVFDDTAASTITLPCHESRNGLSKDFGDKNVLVSFDRLNEESGNDVERIILDSNNDKSYNVQITFKQVVKDSDGSVLSEKVVPSLYKINAGKECSNDLPDGLSVGDVIGVKIQPVDATSVTSNPTITSTDAYNGPSE